MTRADLWTLKQRLDALHQSLQAGLSQSETESVHALSAYDNHPADLATDTFSRELDLGLSMGIERRLAQIERAQEKLNEGTYGICDRCGTAIDGARMRFEPEAVLCIDCQQKQNVGYQGPPSEADVVPYPFGDRRDIHRDVVEADGEDFWQSVAQWGTSNSPQDVPPAVDYQETFVGFEEPIGYVEDIEEIVDENGEVLFDTLRSRALRHAASIDAESDEYLY